MIEVWRTTYTPLSTQGQLGVDGIHVGYTLEPRKDQSQGKPYCIPVGTYDYKVGPSAHFNRNVILVLNVPGFTNIEVHPGNFPTDTHGCCLVGKTEGKDFVGQSDDEFNDLMGKIPPVGQIQYIDSMEAIT